VIAAAVIIAGMKPVLAIACLLAVAVGTSAAANPALWRLAGWKTDFNKHTVPLDEILPGGPPRDGIPPIDRPLFKPANDVTGIAAREPVIVYPLDADARAYPLRILTWHEIVNDEIAGKPVAVTYCPLCNASLVFDRRVGDRVLDFGTSGLLRKSDLVMWDRQTESWWQQFSGEGIVGHFAGTKLKLLPSRVMAYGDFIKQWPHNPVLVPRNPALRPYGRNPYVGYDKRTAPLGFFQGELPKGLPVMAHVVIARTPKGPVAVSLALLAERNRIENDGVIFTWRPGQASALGSGEIAQSHDIGNVAVTDTAGAPLVHDIAFAFVFNAFVKNATVLTGKGRVNLANGQIVTR